MRYENRVKLTIRTPSSDPDNEYEEETTDWIEAHVTGVSSQMNINVFGSYKSDAVAIHLKGHYFGVQNVLINGVTRKPQVVINVRQNTVMVVQGV
ncbi:hypothetical protein [Weissella cibaria]|uniref:hypothetical protein n=1 Tax=Weissella cibaria TaxID=137591 RepID=UPI001C1FEBB4|nr:hypothetical protein [Weissella cibaria]MBU7544332.1 hypothetical protein [Weissella cibaria]MCV3317385.1 hypothetical protein [Weissella cibaria]